MLDVMKMTVRFGVCSICIIAILFGVAVMTAHFNGYSFGTISSGSMEPALEVGDAVVVSNNTNQIEEGDIIIFESDTSDIPVCHRVVTEFPDDHFVTKGDANEVMDNDIVHRDDVIGEVRHKIPVFGNVLEFCRSTIGIAVLIVCSVGTVFMILYRNRERIPIYGSN